MSTAIVLGNGSLTINLDYNLQMTDFYYPYVGQENHLALFPNKTFFWINGDIQTINNDNWEIEVLYESANLIGVSKLKSKKYKLTVTFTDFVVHNQNIFVRKVDFINTGEEPLNIRLYTQNNFSIFESDIGDTTLWYQPAHCLVHYKKNRYIGITSTNKIYQFNCAAKTDTQGKGAYPNEQTGELYFNPISTGSVNSCLSHSIQLGSGEKSSVDQTYVCGSSYEEIQKLVENIDIVELERSTRKHWDDFIKQNIQNLNLKQVENEELKERILKLYNQSLLILRTHIDNNGAVLASNDARALKEGGKDTNAYHWPRDAAYILLTLIECGYKDLVLNYYEHAQKLLTEEGYFYHKYYPGSASNEKGIGSSWHPWVDFAGNFQLPIQVDETSLVLYSMEKYYEKFKDKKFLEKYWDKMIFPMTNFLGNYRYTLDYEVENIQSTVTGFVASSLINEFDKQFANSKLPKPSYDIWEEVRCISTFSCSSVYAGLKSGANLSKILGKTNYYEIFNRFANEVKESTIEHFFDKNLNHFVSRVEYDQYTTRPLWNRGLDSSIYSIWHFGMLDVNDPMVISSIEAVENKLKIPTNVGGIARHENDHYNRIDPHLQGNPWFICTLWIAQYYIKQKNFDKAKEYILWVLEHSDATGLIAEQANPYFGHSESFKPLTWSHSEFIRTINMLNEDF